MELVFYTDKNRSPHDVIAIIQAGLFNSFNCQEINHFKEEDSLGFTAIGQRASFFLELEFISVSDDDLLLWRLSINQTGVAWNTSTDRDDLQFLRSGIENALRDVEQGMRWEE